VAVVSRSSQFEKEDVTHDNLRWDVGNGIAVTGAATCGTSKCLSVKIDHLGDDWKRYRYRLFETIVPLRNMIWNS
jgi:type IV pilus assembly protein PilW